MGTNTHSTKNNTEKKRIFFPFYTAEKADTESCFVRPGVKLMDLNKAGLFILRSAVAGGGGGVFLLSFALPTWVLLKKSKQKPPLQSLVSFFFFTFRQSLFKKEVFPGLLSA